MKNIVVVNESLSIGKSKFEIFGDSENCLIFGIYREPEVLFVNDCEC